MLYKYHGENKLNFDEMIMISALHETNMLCSIFIMLAHWNNYLQVDLLLHFDSLFGFQAN